MTVFINEVNNRLLKSIDDELKSGKSEFELKDKFGRFSMDTIASCAFGVDAGSFTDPNSNFVQNARNVFRRNVVDIMKIILAFLPGGLQLTRTLGISIIKPIETKFFYDVLLQTLKDRESGKVKRNDLVDLMIKAMKEDNTEENHEDDNMKLNYKPNKKELDEMSLIATSLVMLVAGYDTTAQTLSYCIYELAKRTDIQGKLQNEIDEAFEENQGEFPTYAKIQAMEYLDMVFHETLRLHIAVPLISRGCVKDFQIPNSNVMIKKNEEIFINAAGIHHDAKYYPNPEHFKNTK